MALNKTKTKTVASSSPSPSVLITKHTRRHRHRHHHQQQHGWLWYTCILGVICVGLATTAVTGVVAQEQAEEEGGQQEQEQLQQQHQSDLEGDIDFESLEYQCDNGPNALSDAYGKHIPRTCIDVPHTEEGFFSEATTIERCYFTYVPESCKDRAATTATTADVQQQQQLRLPLVFDIHGLASCPLYSAGYTGWMQKAEEECFVVVWPTGNVGDNFWTEGCWNLPGYMRDADYGNDVMTAPCCCYEKNPLSQFIPSKQPDDPLFLRMAIDSVVESFATTAAAAAATTNANVNADPENDNNNDNNNNDNLSITIDTSRVYMAGHSNGCIASLAMAALHSDVVAAVCCHAGTLLTPIPEDYSPVPVWMVHGASDDVVPYDGGVEMDLGILGSMGTWSIEDTVSYIADRNECDDNDNNNNNNAEPIETTYNTNTNNNTNNTNIGTTYKRTNCTNGADVELVTLFATDHYPYAPVPNSTLPFIEDPGVDTTAMAWEFCSSYSKQQQQEDETNEYNEKEPKDTETDDERNGGGGGSGASSASQSWRVHELLAVRGTIVLLAVTTTTTIAVSCFCW